MKRLKRSERGFALITVLMLLVVLTMTATLLLESTTNTLEVSSGVKAYAIAQARSQMGVQHMRAESLNAVTAIANLGICPDVATAEAGGCPIVPLTNGAVDGGYVDFAVSPITGTNDLSEGAGSQYRAYVVNLGNGVGLGSQARYFIISTGYYGFANSPFRRESRVIVETTLPTGVVEAPPPSGVGGTG